MNQLMRIVVQFRNYIPIYKKKSPFTLKRYPSDAENPTSHFYFRIGSIAPSRTLSEMWPQF